MEKYQNRFITFPVHMFSDNGGRMPFTENKIDYIPKKWRKLVKSIPFKNGYYDENYMTSYFYQHMGILTGRKSNITVIEYNYIPSTKMNTLCIKTLMGHKYVIYKHEPLLHSIYNESGSVLNNGCCIFYGYNYQIIEDMPIAKMPNSIFEDLMHKQNNRNATIDRRMLELMMILPEEYFEDKCNIDYLIDVMKSVQSSNTIRINTLRKLFTYKYDLFRERYMVDRVNNEATYDQKKVTLASLKKTIAAMNKRDYESWSRKWMPRMATRLRYREGSLVKLSEVNEIYDKPALKERMQKNDRFCIVKKNICKSCKKLHKTGCCSEYNRINYTTALFILNGYIAK